MAETVEVCAERLAKDVIILNQLQKRNSGVYVTKAYNSISETNQISLFEVLSVAQKKSKRSLHQASYQKWTHFQGQTCHADLLQRISDLPDELALREVERVFLVSFNVYVLELIGESFRSVLVRKGKGDEALNVVFLSGRYLLIKNLTQFQKLTHVRLTSHAASTMVDSPRLQWIKNHKHIHALILNRSGVAYKDDLGFFRCLAVHQDAPDVETKTQELHDYYFSQYTDEDRPSSTTDPHVRLQGQGFNGLNLFSELDRLESVFRVKINIYRLGACSHEIDEDDETHICPSIVRLSDNSQFEDTLHLLAYGAHLCYISDINYLSPHIACSKCGKAVKNKQYYSHFKRCRGAPTHIGFNKKTYSVSRTLAEECALRGVTLDESLEFRPYFCTWDIETYCPQTHVEKTDEGVEFPIVRENDIQDTDLRSEVDNINALLGLLEEADDADQSAPTSTSRTEYSTPHTLLSIAVASNVPGYEICRVFVTDGDSQALFDRFMNYVAEVQVAAGRLLARSVRCTVRELLRVEAKESQHLWEKLDEALEEKLNRRLKGVVGEKDDYVMSDDDEGSDDETGLAYDTLAFDEAGLNVETEETKVREKVELPPRAQRSVSALIGRLTSECRVLPLLSFNGSGYDQIVCAKYLLPYFHASPQARKYPEISDDVLHREFFPRRKRKKKGNGGQSKRGCFEEDFCADFLYDEEAFMREEEEEDFLCEAEGGEEDGGWEDSGSPKVIKRGSRYLLLSNSRFKLLDICHFNAAGTTYAQYLEGYECKEQKLPFPYEYVKSLEDLKSPQLPSQTQFYNSLKQKACTDEEYAQAKALWHERGMRTFRDYLVAYNASDVLPFIEALEKQKTYFKKEHGIHLFDHVSIPAISDRILQQKTPPGTWFSTLAKRDADLFESFNSALQGGKL